MRKYALPLTEAERLTLTEAYRHGPSSPLRQRAQAMLRSSEGCSIGELRRLFEVGRNTVSAWLERWAREGLRGLYDAPRSGRPPIYTQAEQQRLLALLEADPCHRRRAQAQLAQETGKPASERTVLRVLKNTVGCGSAAGTATSTGATRRRLPKSRRC